MVAAVIAQLVKKFYKHPLMDYGIFQRGEALVVEYSIIQMSGCRSENKGQYTTKSKTVLSSRQDLSHENYKS